MGQISVLRSRASLPAVGSSGDQLSEIDKRAGPVGQGAGTGQVREAGRNPGEEKKAEGTEAAPCGFPSPVLGASRRH